MAKYTAICHTDCYWKNTLWLVGEVYEGDDPPGKHFSQDGIRKGPRVPLDPGTDPRSNVALRQILKDHGVGVPPNWSRKQMWARVRQIEIAVSKDELTNPNPEKKKELPETPVKKAVKKRKPRKPKKV